MKKITIIALVLLSVACSKKDANRLSKKSPIDGKWLETGSTAYQDEVYKRFENGFVLQDYRHAGWDTIGTFYCEGTNFVYTSNGRIFDNTPIPYTLSVNNDTLSLFFSTTADVYVRRY
jgi:hypothetical protein